jgi:hypothetical protein
LNIARSMTRHRRRDTSEGDIVVDNSGNRSAIRVLLIPLVCCAGIALWLAIGGAGLAGAGALGGSVWLLVMGVLVLAVAVVWWARRGA